MSGHIYLFQEREFINSGEDIYKVGKTKQEFNKRFSSYPKGTEAHLQLLDEIEQENYFNIKKNKKYEQSYAHRLQTKTSKNKPKRN